MRLLILFCVIAAAVYVAAFFVTRDPAIAVNAGGLVALLYLIILVIQATKPPFPRKFRLWVMAVALVSIGCVAATWLTQFYLSHWQRSTLLHIRNVISQAWGADTLATRSLKTLEVYHNKSRSSKETFAEVFRRLNPPSESSTNVIDTFFNDEQRTKVGALTYIESVADSEIVLLGRDVMSPRQDSIFTVLKMDIGKPWMRLRLTPRGVKYEFKD